MQKKKEQRNYTSDETMVGQLNAYPWATTGVTPLATGSNFYLICVTCPPFKTTFVSCRPLSQSTRRVLQCSFVFNSTKVHLYLSFCCSFFLLYCQQTNTKTSRRYETSIHKISHKGQKNSKRNYSYTTKNKTPRKDVQLCIGYELRKKQEQSIICHNWHEDTTIRIYFQDGRLNLRSISKTYLLEEPTSPFVVILWFTIIYH